MKRFLLTFVVVAASCSLALAQGAGGGKAGAGTQGGRQGGRMGGGGMGGGMMGGGRRMDPKMMEKMRSEIYATLKLTSAQKKKLVALDKEQDKKMMAMRSSFKPGQPPSPDMRSKMEGLRSWREAELGKILSKKEIEELRAATRKWREAHGMGRMGGQGGPGGRMGGPGGAAGGGKSGGGKGGH